ncbi:GGDEF domain-containing protein [Paracidovorax wautersii]|uniref:GGDEF domain-containing protein n=1 Tax=Paracidovorax wautersii TaxID=1177982 RepID=UPI0031E0675E
MAAIPSALPAHSKLAHKAFWVMSRRVTVMAAGVDLAFLVLFTVLGSPVLAWLNVISIALYAAAYGLLMRRANVAALMLIWLEVTGHAALGTWLIGWDSGFHYYLLMFIPAIVVSSNRQLRTTLLLVALFVFYMGLHTMSRHVGAQAPLSAHGLAVVHGFNVAVVFCMAAYTARFYYDTVRRAEEQLQAQAATDPLTGLSNRRNLIARAERTLAEARQAGRPTALVIADIDHFKRINDRYGHDAGDQVLVSIGARLLRASRAHDVVARWGGEEFLILLPDTSAEAAQILAERVRSAVAEAPIEHHAGGRIEATLSLGVCEVGAGESMTSAIARADRALYRSKDAGRDRVTTACIAA